MYDYLTSWHLYVYINENSIATMYSVIDFSFFNVMVVVLPFN